MIGGGVCVERTEAAGVEARVGYIHGFDVFVGVRAGYIHGFDVFVEARVEYVHGFDVFVEARVGYVHGFDVLVPGFCSLPVVFCTLEVGVGSATAK